MGISAFERAMNSWQHWWRHTMHDTDDTDNTMTEFERWRQYIDSLTMFEVLEKLSCFWPEDTDE